MHENTITPVLSRSDANGNSPGSQSHVLDNPIWNALTTEQAGFALGEGLARRFDPAIGPLSGIADTSAATYEALRTVAGPGGVLVVFYTEPPAAPEGWSLIRGAEMVQMVCAPADGAAATANQPLATGRMRPLGVDDVPAMVALAELTEPGPFRERTIELGAFFGIFEGKRLLAMAGQRMRMPAFIEVSAVCTHPDARGRGYARAVMARVMEDIREQGRTPFLHSLAANASAIRVYESLGFAVRRKLELGVWKNDR